MKSAVLKRAIVVDGRKTSISLEDECWDGLKELAKNRNVSMSQLVTSINARRRRGTLSSAIRLCVLAYYCTGEA